MARIAAATASGSGAKFPGWGGADYAGRAVQWLGRRLVNLVVGAFALMGFCLVPLGGRTALEHVVELGRTDAARRFAQGLVSGARAVADEVETVSASPSSAAPPSSANPAPVVPKLPKRPAPTRRPPANVMATSHDSRANASTLPREEGADPAANMCVARPES